jgi:hypothetical protein
MILITTQITGIEQALSKIKSKSIRNDALKKLDEIKIALKEIQKEAGYLEVLRIETLLSQILLGLNPGKKEGSS